MAQAGIIKPAQTYVILKEVGAVPALALDDFDMDAEPSLVGLELEIMKSTWVQQELDRFECSEGVFEHRTTDEITAEIVQSEGSDRQPIHSAVFDLLKVVDSGSGRLKVDSFELGVLSVTIADVDEHMALEDAYMGSSGEDDLFLNRARASARDHHVAEEPGLTDDLEDIRDMGDWLAADLESLLIAAG